MSTALLLPLNTIQLWPLVQGFAIFGCACLVLLTFRPLLIGIMRAAWLMLFPRPGREQLSKPAPMAAGD